MTDYLFEARNVQDEPGASCCIAQSKKAIKDCEGFLKNNSEANLPQLLLPKGGILTIKDNNYNRLKYTEYV